MSICSKYILELIFAFFWSNWFTAEVTIEFRNNLIPSDLRDLLLFLLVLQDIVEQNDLFNLDYSCGLIYVIESNIIVLWDVSFWKLEFIILYF